MCSQEVPPFKAFLSRLPVRLVEQLLQSKLDAVRPPCLQLVVAEMVQLGLLMRGQLPQVLQPQIPCPLEYRSCLHFLLPYPWRAPLELGQWKVDNRPKGRDGANEEKPIHGGADCDDLGRGFLTPLPPLFGERI
jgi:hypothetical protein